MIDFDSIDEFDYDNATAEERAAYHEWVIKDQNLDEEEAWYERHFDEFVPCGNQAEMRKQVIKTAEEPSEPRKNKKPVTFRMDMDDIKKIKKIATEQGLQYQSLVGSILHRYAAGTLVDITEARKILAAR